MKNDNTSHQTNIPRATFPLKKETFRVEFKICGYGGGETAFEIEGGYDIPLGMVQGHLHRTVHSNEVIFENSVSIPLKMAAIRFLEGKFVREVKQSDSTAEDCYSPARHGGPVVATSHGLDPMPAASCPLDEFSEPEAEIPRVPTFEDYPPFLQAALLADEAKRQEKAQRRTPPLPKAPVPASPAADGIKKAA